jgi:glutaconate CoA-transferase subunit B
VYKFAGDGEMYLASLHPGVTVEDVRANCAWEMTIAEDVAETPRPSDDELRLIREDLDPEGIYTSR